LEGETLGVEPRPDAAGLCPMKHRCLDVPDDETDVPCFSCRLHRLRIEFGRERLGAGRPIDHRFPARRIRPSSCQAGPPLPHRHKAGLRAMPQAGSVSARTVPGRCGALSLRDDACLPMSRVGPACSLPSRRNVHVAGFYNELVCDGPWHGDTGDRKFWLLSFARFRGIEL
jgi:hypothetical protein